MAVMQLSSGHITQLITCFILGVALCCNTAAQDMSPKYQVLNDRISTDPQGVLDELLQTQVNAEDPLDAAQHHLTLSHIYLNLVYPQKSLEHSNQALAFLQEQQPAWLYHRILLTQSQALELTGQAAAGKPLIEQAVSWAEQNEDQAMLIDALIGLGYIENTLTNSVAALDAFMRAYDMAPAAGAVITKSAIAGSIALVYEYRKEFALAIPYFQQAVDYHRSTDNQLELSIALYGLGRANKNVGKTQLGNQQLQESLDISRTINDEQGVAYALKELAPMHIDAGQLDTAEAMLQEAIQLFSRSENQFMLFDSHKTLGQLFLSKSDPEQAQHHIEQAKIYLDEKTMPIQAISLAETESQILAAQQQYQDAFEQLIGTIGKKQRLLTEQSTRQLHELRTQYEVEQQSQANLLLAQENAEQKLDLIQQQQHNRLLWLGMIAAILIAALLFLLVYRSRKQKQALFQLANFDSLTGLPNRARIMQLIEDQHQQLKADQHLHIGMLDLDHFKQINDQLGHDTGDRVLRAIGDICRQHIQAPHLAGRFGGEEFLLAFINLSSQQVQDIMDAIKVQAETLARLLQLSEHQVSFSAGVRQCDQTDPLKDSISFADQAMYAAKHTGRNRVVFSQHKAA